METALANRSVVSACAMWRLRLPLRVPYKLAFGSIESFDTVLVRLEIDGRVGWGEATVLTGYTEETIEGSWALARQLGPSLVERPAAAAREALEPHLAKAPFTVSAFGTALDMALDEPILTSDRPRRVPLLKILNATEPATIETEIEAAIDAGYRTIKVKAGFDLEADLARIRAVQRIVQGRLAITVDANQGFSREDGCSFASRIDPNGILFFEQACHKDDWDAALAVARSSTVPVMLDESIYDLADVRRAAASGAAAYVKLKLMKFGSLAALERGLQEVKALGMIPVLGNGVAADVGCWMEACVGAAHVTTAGEMNGFLKPRRPVVLNPLAVEGGAVIIPARYRPVIDDSAVTGQAVDHREFA
jgi:L-alanine-DL-glutamate epimerase-like enolase superfamily enzyme